MSLKNSLWDHSLCCFRIVLVDVTQLPRNCKVYFKEHIPPCMFLFGMCYKYMLEKYVQGPLRNIQMRMYYCK